MRVLINVTINIILPDFVSVERELVQVDEASEHRAVHSEQLVLRQNTEQNKYCSSSSLCLLLPLIMIRESYGRKFDVL